MTRFCAFERFLPFVTVPCKAIVLMSIGLMLSTASTSAEVAVSNLGNFNNGNFGITQSPPYTYGRAQSFTTGEETAFLLSATLGMSGFDAYGEGGFQVSLYSSIDQLPGESLLSLSGSDAPVVSGDYKFDAPIRFELAPNTTYWIVASLPLAGPPAAHYWTFTVNHNENALPGWSMGTSAHSTSFMGWEPTWGIQSVPLRMEIEADFQPIPEPSTAVTAVLLVGTAAFSRPRRRM